MSDRDFFAGDYDTEWVSFLWPNTGTGPLRVSVGWRLLEERWECVSLGIGFVRGSRILRTSDLRSIKMGALLERAAVELRETRDTWFPPGSEVTVWNLGTDEAGSVVKTVTTKPDPRAAEEALPKRIGRPVVSLETLQEVARIYTEAREEGEPTTKAVQEHFGIKPERARRWVWKCRNECGLLPARNPQANKPREATT